MDEVDTGLRDLFLLSLALIFVVYFVGLSTDVATLGNALTSLINVATGRNAQGQFAGYPNGGTVPTTSATGIGQVVTL